MDIRKVLAGYSLRLRWLKPTAQRGELRLEFGIRNRTRQPKDQLKPVHATLPQIQLQGAVIQIAALRMFHTDLH